MSDNVPNDLHYTEEHEWIRLDGKIATMGITQFAVEQLGDVTQVDLPREGETLKQGDVLDGMGFYMTYGQAENADVVARESLLPIGLAEGCRLKRALSRDAVLTYDDVELPPGRLCDELRAEQNAYFSLAGQGRSAREA